MSQSTDESRIREMIQRLKHADEQHAPDFDDVLARPVRKLKRRPARRLQLAVVCCTASALLGTILFVQAQQSDPPFDNDLRRAKDVGSRQPIDSTHDRSPQQRVADIDFDHLRRVVEEHCAATEMANGARVPVWSSRTESLLALNLDVSLAKD